MLSNFKAFFRLKTRLIIYLYCFMLFSLLLTALRVLVTGRWSFSRLSWNLLLAYIPFLISLAFLKLTPKPSLRYFSIPFFFCWFLFLPNTFYLVTDMVHLGEGKGGNYWYDLLLLLSYAVNGVVLGVLSIRNMELGFNRIGMLRVRWYFSMPMLFIASVGMMIGRLLRYNSWSIFLHPEAILYDLWKVTVVSEKAVVFWGYSLLCFLILLVGYWITGKILKAGKKLS